MSPAFWEAATGENRTPRPLPTVTYSIVSVHLRKSTNISRKTRTLSQCLIVLSYHLQEIWGLCHSHLLFLHSPHLLFKDLIFLSLPQPFLAALLTCSCSGKFDLRLTDWTILSVWKLNSYQVLHWHSAIRWSRWEASAGWCDWPQLFDRRNMKYLFVADTALSLTALPAPYFIVLLERRQELICRDSKLDRFKSSA